MEKKNVLLYTNNHRGSLEQVFSTYGLYRTLEELGLEPVVYDEPRKGCTRGESYLNAHCSMVSEMCVPSDREAYLNSFNAVLTGGERKWECAKEESVDKCFLNWGKFQGIAAADNMTQRILNLEFQMDAEMVCNPILLSEGFSHLDADQIEGLFITAVFDRPNRQKQKAAEMAEETLKYRVLDYSREVMARNRITIDEYLNAIEKSSLIITDSAAAIHLAVVYRKPFIAVLSCRSSEASGVFSTLESLELLERVIDPEEDVREKKYLCRKPVKYGLVDYKLEKLRAKSIQWLENSLNGQEADK